jgi:hypothetical protein
MEKGPLKMKFGANHQNSQKQVEKLRTFGIRRPWLIL